MLKATKVKEGEISTVFLAGAMDVHSHDTVRDAIFYNSIGASNSLLINLKGLTDITSSGIGLLLNAYIEVQRQGRVIKLINVGPSLLEKFQVNKVLAVFSIFPDAVSAKKQIDIDLEERGKDYVRLFERINVELKAKFRVFMKVKASLASGFQSALVRSLSKHGMFMKTHNEIENHTLLEVKLILPQGVFKREQVRFLAKVVRKATDEGDEGFGLNILHMDCAEMERLDNYLSKQGK